MPATAIEETTKPSPLTQWLRKRLVEASTMHLRAHTRVTLALLDGPRDREVLRAQASASDAFLLVTRAALEAIDRAENLVTAEGAKE